YAYARGNRSSRGIERACWEDVAYKVITGMRTPDHSTIAEFRRRHEAEIEGLFDDVLGLCREAGLVSVGVSAIDGAQVKADPEMVLGRGGRRGGRREWPRVARRELEEQRARDGRPIPRDREDRLFQALGRLEQNHRADLVANQVYDHWRATARDTKGRVLKGNSKPFVPPELPDGVINLSDPDSRVMRTQGTPPRQAYNAQTAVNDRQVILAAEITVDAPDFGHLEPMLDTTLRHLERHGVTEMPEVLLGDAGYWHSRQIQAIGERGVEVLIPPDGNMREGKRPGWENGFYEKMRRKL